MKAEIASNSPLTNDTKINIDLIKSPESLQQFSLLLDQGFSVSDCAHYLDDFPIWDERYKTSGDDLVKIGAFHRGSLVSATGVRMAVMRTALGDLPVALIGAVVTEDGWQGKGLASKTVSLAVEWAEQRGAVLCLLWGSEHALYQRLEFELQGTQVRIPLAELALPLKVKVAKEECEIHQGWTEGIFRALASRPFGLKFTESDRNWLSAHRNVKWYLAGDPRNPLAYAAVGRGIDLPGIVHEWGGEPDALFQLLSFIRDEIPEASLLGLPKLLKQYQFMFQESQKEYLCLARVLKPEFLATVRGWDALPLWVWGLDGA